MLHTAKKDDAMSESVFDLTAYCGLYCGDCNRFRSRASDLARDLLAELDSTKFDKYVKVKSTALNQPNKREELRYYPEFRDIIETIIDLKCENPCRIGGGCPTFSCKIMECCLTKGLDGCWQCDTFESCTQFDFLKAMHGDSLVENLRAIREHGIDNWVEHRGKFYVWD